jgi:hypothetical protein
MLNIHRQGTQVVSNSAWPRDKGRTYALTSTSEFCPDLLFNRTHVATQTPFLHAAHDILFDQEPCSATGSNLSCVPSAVLAS